VDSITERKDAWPVADNDESDLLDLMVTYAPGSRPRARIGTEPLAKSEALVPVPALASPSTFEHLEAAFDTLSPAAKAGVVLAATILASVALGWLVGSVAKAASVRMLAAMAI
jgi:hypothetical protein